MFRLIDIIGGRKDTYGKIYRIYTLQNIRDLSLLRNVQTDYGVQQASNPTKTGWLVDRAQLEADHSLSFNAEVQD